VCLAHKLYLIGKSIGEEEIIKSLIERELDDSIDYITVAIDFTLQNGQLLKPKILNSFFKNTFYSEKLGGSGEAIFYLYPNLIVHNDILIKIKNNNLKGKFAQLIATLENIIDNRYANEQNEILLQEILKQIQNPDVINKLKEYPKGNYLYLITINGKTLFELMPEIWDNWFKNPVIVHTNLEVKIFYDFITSQKTHIGYNPDIGCYTVINYDDKLKYRIIDNLPLSQESARLIKFGWLYAKKNLLFYFDGMQYMIIPSYSKENLKEFKGILTRLKCANENNKMNRNTLKIIANEEKKLCDMLERLKKRKKKDEKKIQDIEKEFEQKVVAKMNLQLKVAHGLFTNFANEIKDLEFIHGLTLDFIFLELNKNEVKIFGSLEEVIPSRVLGLVEKMKDYQIEDTIVPLKKDPSQTYLRDFFHRDELYFYELNKLKNDPKDSSYRSKILQERFYFAKLLLGSHKITKKDLYKRFEFNAEYDYGHKKRLNGNMVKVWIDDDSAQILRDEERIFNFLKDINVLKD